VNPPRQAPLEVARDTFLIRAVQSSLGGSTTTSHNSLVIRAAEPVIVDTGMVTNRAEFFDDLFSLVEPDDVRWLYLTHDDDDHSGNLLEALARCPNATVVTSWAASGRMCAAFGIPPERVRTVDDGETLEVGDRSLRAIRPPVYDSAYTRGVFDPTTRVYHAADAFCTPMPAMPVDRVDEIPARMWEEGMAMFSYASLCPWIAMVDEAKFTPQVERLAALGAEVIVGAHTPVISGSSIERAFELLAALPSTSPTPLRPTSTS
jgi:flavorubredoxin